MANAPDWRRLECLASIVRDVCEKKRKSNDPILLVCDLKSKARRKRRRKCRRLPAGGVLGVGCRRSVRATVAHDFYVTKMLLLCPERRRRA